MDRSAGERLMLWSSVIAAAASVLPWYDDGGPVWSVVGFVTCALALFAWWRAAMWGSPVVVGCALFVGLVLSVVGGLGPADNYEAITPFVVVAVVAFATGLVGAVRAAPAR